MTPRYPLAKYTTCLDRGKWAARILAKVEIDGAGCWIWQGAPTWNGGYGRFGIGRRDAITAHRASFLTFVGDMPADHVPDHLCRVHLCVNPDHLESVTHAENIRRGGLASARGSAQKSQTHCIHGHEFTSENTGTTRRGGSGQGFSRYCKTCARKWCRAAAERSRAKARA